MKLIKTNIIIEGIPIKDIEIKQNFSTKYNQNGRDACTSLGFERNIAVSQNKAETLKLRQWNSKTIFKLFRL